MTGITGETLPISNPENFTSSPPLQTHIGLYIVTGEKHYLTPTNNYDPKNDNHIQENVDTVVKSAGKIKDDVVEKLDIAHRNERKEKWKTIANVKDVETDLFVTHPDKWKTNAAAMKLLGTRTELTDPAEKIFVAQFEIWSDNFQTHFLNPSSPDTPQTKFIKNFLGVSSTLVITKDNFQKEVALKAYENFIRTLDTKQAQQSTVFLDRVKDIYNNNAIPEEDMTMIATLAEQLFGGETMGKVIAEIVDLQARLRSKDPSVNVQLNYEIGKQPTPEAAKTISDFRKLAEIEEKKYDSTAQPAEVLQTATPKDNEQLMKNAGEVVELTPTTTTVVDIKSNEDYFGSSVQEVKVDNNGYLFAKQNDGMVVIQEDGSCHIEQQNSSVIVTGQARFYREKGSQDNCIILRNRDSLIFTPKDWNSGGLISGNSGQTPDELKKQEFVVPNDNTKKTERPVDGHKYVVIECENVTKADKAFAVFEEKQIAEPGKSPQTKLIFLDGDLTDNYMALERRLLQKTGLLIDVVDPKVKDKEFTGSLEKGKNQMFEDIQNAQGKLDDNEDVAKILDCTIFDLQNYATNNPKLVKQAILEFLISKQVQEEITDLAVQKTYTQFGKTGFSLEYVPQDLVTKLKLDNVGEYSTNGQVDPNKLDTLYDTFPSTPKPPTDMKKSIAGFCNAYKQSSAQEKNTRIKHYYSLLKITRPTSFKPTLPGAPEQTLPQFEAPKTLAEMFSYHHYVAYKKDRSLINIRATGRIDRGSIGPNRYLIDVSYLTDAPVSLLCVADKGEDRCGIRRNPDDTITMVWADGIGSGIFPALVAYEGVEYALSHLDSSLSPTAILQSVSDYVQTLKLDELADQHFTYEWDLRKKGVTFPSGTEEHNDQESITGDDGNTNPLARQLGQINRYRLIQKSFGGMSMTATIYSQKENKISFAIAGNTGVAVFHRNGKFETYENDDRIPGTQIQFETEKNPKHDPSKEIIKDITLENNDVVIGYSDGFYKAFLPKDVQPWIDEYFAQTNPTTPLEQFLTTRLKSEIAKRTPNDPGDDVTIIVLHHKQTIPEAAKPEPIPAEQLDDLTDAILDMYNGQPTKVNLTTAVAEINTTIGIDPKIAETCINHASSIHNVAYVENPTDEPEDQKQHREQTTFNDLLVNTLKIQDNKLKYSVRLLQILQLANEITFAADGIINITDRLRKLITSTLPLVKLMP